MINFSSDNLFSCNIFLKIPLPTPNYSKHLKIITFYVTVDVDYIVDD